MDDKYVCKQICVQCVHGQTPCRNSPRQVQNEGEDEKYFVEKVKMRFPNMLSWPFEAQSLRCKGKATQICPAPPRGLF